MYLEPYRKKYTGKGLTPHVSSGRAHEEEWCTIIWAWTVLEVFKNRCLELLMVEDEERGWFSSAECWAGEIELVEMDLPAKMETKLQIVADIFLEYLCQTKCIKRCFYVVATFPITLCKQLFLKPLIGKTHKEKFFYWSDPLRGR